MTPSPVAADAAAYEHLCEDRRSHNAFHVITRQL